MTILGLLLSVSLVAGPAAAGSFTPDQLIQVARSYMDRGQDRQALEPLRLAIEADEEKAEAHRLMGLALSRLDRPAEAEPHLARAIELAPGSYETQLLLGMARDLAGSYQSAMEAYRAAIEIDGSRPCAHRELGMTELLNGDAKAAVASLRRASALSEKPDAGLLADLGYALFAAGEAEAAVETLDRAAETDPRDPEVRFILGRVHAAGGRVDEALTAFDAALEQRPDHALAAYHKGLTLARADRRAEAIASFERAIEHRPTDARILTALGRALASQGDLAGAAARLSAAVEAEPSFAVAWRDLAAVREASGDLREALSALRRAATLLPGDKAISADVSRLEALATEADPSADGE